METIYKTFDVALELKQTSTNAPFYVIEGDNGNKIRITVTDGGSAVALTDCRVIAVFSKSSGTSMQDSAEAGGGVTIGGTYNNEVTVALRPASIAPGQVECELQIYSDENKTTLITTAKFNFECQRAIFNENTAMATNEYPLLVSLISVCNGIVAAEELRVTAEQERVSAENTRVSQEQERQVEILKIANMTVVIKTLPANENATASITEDSEDGHKILNLGIPKGKDGADGNVTTDTVTNITGLLKGANGKIAEAIANLDYQTPLVSGTDYQPPIPAGTYATPDDVSGAVSGHNSANNAHSALFSKKQTAPALASSLPASGTALTANTIYNVSSPVGTYVFTPPASGWAHGTFSTAASVAVSFVSGANYLGEAPAIEASKTYEFDVYNGVWAVQEVVSA